MATANPNPESPTTAALSPAVRRRLQQCFDAGTKNTQTGNYDYATEMLTQCVTNDPGNQIYAQAFLGNLYRKYNNNKKGITLASMRSATSKAAMMNANRKKDWLNAMKSGFEILKLNPWDVPALLQIAKAAAELKLIDAQLTYLKAAQTADPKSAEVQRECAVALKTIGQFDQAIACWVKVDQLTKGGSEEAQHQITELQVEKSMGMGGLKREADASGGEEGAKAGSAMAPVAATTKRTPLQMLEDQISASPGEVNPYSQLAEFHVKNLHLNEAEAVLQRGLQATGGDMRLREQLEDLQLGRTKQNLLVAERRASESNTEEAKQQVLQLRAELNRQELDVYRGRVERYPTNTTWKYELGVRLKRSGNFNEAIKLLQEARHDPKYRGTVLLDLGECFQQIKQFRLAKQHYAAAVGEMPEKELDLRKKALYRAGALAMGLAEQDEAELAEAEKYLTELAALDFGYKDVSDRLDKIAKRRDKE